MKTQQEMKDLLLSKIPGSTLVEGTQLTEIQVDAANLHEAASLLKSDKDLAFDYLIDQTAVDHTDHFTLVLHLASSRHPEVIVLKTNLTGRENLEVQSLSDLWATAEFQEREIIDLFGINFTDHPDPRKLFCEDDYGHPLRKDFRDEINMIER